MSVVGDKPMVLGDLHSQSEHLYGAMKAINSELWHACAGPLVTSPNPGSLVYYFPQGHIGQVVAMTGKSENLIVPNYPNLPSQLMCQVHNVTLHVDKDTDEIYTQMILQPVNSEKDVFTMQCFGSTQNKQPKEYFCKTLTASDTSAHGGFSVPRSAAEKLFPPLDYSTQPPNQELIVHDLHDNCWTFRHIYRGQPKRHLLTTGWSTFVGAKHLKAGDSVLFVRNEKSQLLLGVRRVDRRQTTLASSVLSADSMHIGVLAAAAHAAENRSSFSVFYSPWACRSEFVIPLLKYHKATFKNQVSVGRRFGMMTEESSKCRSMGTIVGIRDSDPLRWPNSNWEKLQVNWDEPSCSQQPSRVSFWEIEVPENHFIFPTPTSGLKRSLYFEYEESGLGCESKSKKLPSLVLEGRYSNHQNLGSEQLMNMVLKSHTPTSRYQFGCNLTAYSATLKNIANTNLASPVSTYPSAFSIMGTQRQKDVSLAQKAVEQKHVLHCQQLIPTPQTIFHKNQNHQFSSNSTLMNTKRGQIMEKTSQRLNDKGQGIAHSSVNGMHHEKIDAAIAASIGTVSDQSQSTVSTTVQQIFHFPEEYSEESFTGDFRSPQDIVGMTPLLETSNLDSLLTCPGQHPYVNNDEVVVHNSDTQSLTSISRSPIVLSCTSKPEASLLSASAPDQTKSIDGFPIPWTSKANEPEWPPLAQVLSGSSHENCLSHLPQEEDILEKLFQQNIISSCGFKDYSDESSLHVEKSNASIIVDPSVSSTVLEETSPLKESSSIISPDFLLGNFGMSQDVQPYITSRSLSESEAFSHQEVLDIPWKASSSNVNESENNLLHKASWKHVSPPLRTYTKVQKLGCVGRSIDVTRFRNYSELVSAIACMFGLEGKLDDPKGLGWKLVYIDYENDVLLVGDDPWEEFVCCVKCIKILSPAEVQQFES